MHALSLRRTLPVCSCLALLGCEDYLFEQVCPQAIAEVARTVPELEPTPADILFVVDNSGSMREEQENLAANFRAFINALAGSGGDYRLAIITTDATGQNQCGVSGQECGGRLTFNFEDAFPFARQSIDPAGCFEVDTPVTCFRADDSGRRVLSSNLSAAELEQSFQQAVQVGTCGDGIEAGLETMQAALAQARGGECNAGFLRPEANLVVVFVSDERGNSIPFAAKADGIQDDELQPFVEALAQSKDGDLSKVRVAAIVGAVDGVAADCRSDGQPTAQCGSLCDQIPDVLGSEQSCSSVNPCPAGEICTANGAPDNRQRCVDRSWQLYLQGVEAGDERACASCSNYNAPDCCLAEPGDEYVAFVQRVGSLAGGGTGRASCQASDSARTFCLIDSICQENFSVTLDRIARELVAAQTFTLDPPADYPEGLRVSIVSTDGTANPLEVGVDYRVSPDGTTFEFLGGAGPQPGESIELFYTTERTIDRELRGACTSTATAP